jgi:hypothetical protein
VAAEGFVLAGDSGQAVLDAVGDGLADPLHGIAMVRERPPMPYAPTSWSVRASISAWATAMRPVSFHSSASLSSDRSRSERRPDRTICTGDRDGQGDNRRGARGGVPLLVRGIRRRDGPIS